MSCYALDNVLFSDGRLLPEGGRVDTFDDGLPNAGSRPGCGEFDAFRFGSLRQGPATGQGISMSRPVVMISLSHSAGEARLVNCRDGICWLAAILSEHAYPGRFSSSNEMRVILCLVLLDLDVGSGRGGGGHHPIEFEFMATWIPRR